VAARKGRSFEIRRDKLGRENWYRVSADGSAKRVAKPAPRKGDTVLDRSSPVPEKRRHGGRGKGWQRATPTKRERALFEPRDPIEFAKRKRRELMRKGNDPDDVRVFWLSDDGRKRRRYTIKSWAKFVSDPRYGDARSKMAPKGRFVLGLQDARGDLGRSVADLGRGDA